MKHMSDIDTVAFYEWLDLVDVQEGLRVINFYVQEEEDE